jgi:hypothetical protein
VQIFHVPRPARKLRLRDPASRGLPPAAAPGAFYHGTVKNQHRPATEHSKFHLRAKTTTNRLLCKRFCAIIYHIHIPHTLNSNNPKERTTVRKDEKQQVSELIATLHDAHREIRSFIKYGEQNRATEILADCQECIESVYGFICKTTRLKDMDQRKLEELCTEYLKAALQVSKWGASHPYESYDLLNEKLKAIENFADNEIPVSKEIVFFPYKAAMWDSLESVWSAACADPDCDVYVVPIPYYTKNRDGSLGKRHYEGPDFPRYVPVLPFTKYNLKDRKPDIAYIHNPYDEGNHVTSVDPGYYCEEIKKYAGLLVYIPYYVSGTSGLMLRTAASFRADYTIAQSADIGADIAKVAGEKKVLSLGNPKVDAVVNPIGEVNIPEEWQRIIAGRKVVFFNTHINGLINYPGAQIAKLRSVFSDFADRKDLVLLWRPHPFSADTIKSMRAGALQAYQQLVDEYKSNHIGIYDDSADFHAAFFAADAYYGDHSSLIQLFGFTGKPMLRQNIGCVKPDKILRLSAGRLVGDVLYATGMDFQLLFAVDMADGKADFVGASAQDHAANLFTAGGMAQAGDILAFAPPMSENICLYDKKTREIRHLPIKPEYCTSTGNINFQGVAACGGRVFFIPFSYEKILCCDTADGSIRYINYRDKFRSTDILKCPDMDNTVFGGGAAVADGEVYIPLRNLNAVFVINAVKLTSRIVTVGQKRGGYTGCCFAEGSLWLTPAAKNGCLVRWDMETGDITEYPEIALRGLRAASIAYADGRVWVNMPVGSGLYSVDTATNTVHFLAMPETDEQRCAIPQTEFALFIPDENHAFVLAQSASDNRFYKLNSAGITPLFVPEIRDESVERVHAALNEPDTGMSPRGYFHWENRLESPAETLARLIETQPVSDNQKAAFGRMAANADGTAGKKIHEQVKRLIGKPRK